MNFNQQFGCYLGECAQGDREATHEEISAWEESRKPTYQKQRAEEYPPFQDYLDAIVKGDESQKRAYIDACLAVKKKYPKDGT